MILSAWGLEIALITMRDFGISIGPLKVKGTPNTAHGLPLPADYLATFLLFGPLALFDDSPRWGKVAGLIGWAYVLATLLNVLDPSDPTKGKTPEPPAGKS